MGDGPESSTQRPGVSSMADLTPKERRLAELMAADPERVQWRAAAEAGYKGNEASLIATAARTLARVRVREYMAKLGSQAIDRANARTEGAIADLAECLEFLTTVKRARITDYIRDDGEWDVQKLKAAPAGLMKAIEFRSTTSEEGQAFTSQKVTFESALAATQSLLKHYESLGEGAQKERHMQAWAALVERLIGAARGASGKTYEQWLAQEPIDVTAKVLP